MSAGRDVFFDAISDYARLECLFRHGAVRGVVTVDELEARLQRERARLRGMSWNEVLQELQAVSNL